MPNEEQSIRRAPRTEARAQIEPGTADRLLLD